MIRSIATVILFCSATAASGDELTAAKTIQAGTILQEHHVLVTGNSTEVTKRTRDFALGKETSLIVFKGQSIDPATLRDPRIVVRNDVLELHYRSKKMAIRTEARALQDGTKNQKIKVMNLSSRKVVHAKVLNENVALVEN